MSFNYNHQARIFVSLMIIVGVLGGTIQIAAQKRPAAKRPAASKPAPPTKENFDLSEFAPPAPEKTMSASFNNGTLPDFAPMPEAEEQDQASVLAESIATRDENSTAALMTALRAAGYGIRDASGNVEFAQDGWQGLALDSWQIAMIAKLYGNGWGVGLGRFGDSLSILSPAWKKETNVPNIVAAIREASLSNEKSTRFWANLIIELGLRADVPYDLRVDEDVKNARLDALQLTLILTRLAADLNFRAKGNTRPATTAELYLRSKERGARRLIGASERNEFDTGVQTPGAPDEQKLPCSMSELEQLILDINATGMGVIFGEFLKVLENGKVVSETPGQLLGAANAALVLLKLIWTYAALEAEFDMDGDMLTRTKTTQDGERRLLSAKIKLDIGKWQIVNCIRPVLNAAGIDFDLPADGALSGVRVDWNLVEGGLGWKDIWLPGNDDADDSRIVYLDHQSTASDADRKKHYTYTDKEGITRVQAVGYRQKRDLSRMNVRPVIKSMAVDLDIQVKTMKITDKTGAAGTANDLAGNAITFLTGDMLGTVAGVGAETIYRSNFGSSKVHKVPVKDWVPCDGGWRGTVTYKRVLFNRALVENRTGRTHSQRYFTVSREVDMYDARITVTPGETPMIANGFGQIVYRRTSFDYQRADGTTTCGNRGNSIRPVSKEGRDTRNHAASGKGDSALSIYVGGDGMAMINFDLPDAEGTLVSSSTESYSGGCRPVPPHTVNSKTPIRIGGARYTIEQAPLDPINPHILRGKRTIKGPDGRGLVVTWDLSRCS